ncbi:hypothetical protein PUN28_001075 [Cardiocondyla obscurior]|uniref:Uncharacterized protein n=1 Tax=Cardiocondyla obscurior TaxID=286306 RepID=A0AAW2H383_9HYME
MPSVTHRLYPEVHFCCECTEQKDSFFVNNRKMIESDVVNNSSISGPVSRENDWTEQSSGLSKPTKSNSIHCRHSYFFTRYVHSYIDKYIQLGPTRCHHFLY